MELKAEQRTQASTLGQDWSPSSVCFNPSAKCFCHSLQLRATWLYLSHLVLSHSPCMIWSKMQKDFKDKETSGCHRVVCAMKWHHVLSPIETGLGPTDCTSKASMSSSSCFPFSSKVPICPFSIFTSSHRIWFLAFEASHFFFSSSWLFWRVLCCTVSFCRNAKGKQSYNSSLRCCAEQKEPHITW